MQGGCKPFLVFA
ncbi:hypothetical protein J0S82_015641 [Galemys pyrenaicus]|uniref:Uncharacterized protein n=1 Tax=Galemys pyrenaicus TaxID=202257 RepID=A0A8J6DM62_GALPY|nr:hypothetical protein J0S82_015641 [Galemys pyrenaicus]